MRANRPLSRHARILAAALSCCATLAHSTNANAATTYLFSASNLVPAVGQGPVPADPIWGSFTFNNAFDLTTRAFDQTTGLKHFVANVDLGPQPLMGYSTLPGPPITQLQIGGVDGTVAGLGLAGQDRDFLLAINEPQSSQPTAAAFLYKPDPNLVFRSNSVGVAKAEIRVVKTGVQSLSGEFTTIAAVFTPAAGLTQAAADLNVSDFNWRQEILVLDRPNPFFASTDGCVVGNPVTFLTDCLPLKASPGATFFEPPPGGYTYLPGYDPFPYYYDAANLQNNKVGDAHLTFFDRPANSCLAGGSGAGQDKCQGGEATAGSFMLFRTSLVGVRSDNSPTDPFFQFTWSSNFNGTAGGISQLVGFNEIDEGSGTGGVNILSINAAPVPEPLSWMAMLLGFPVCWGITRRRLHSS